MRFFCLKSIMCVVILFSATLHSFGSDVDGADAAQAEARKEKDNSSNMVEYVAKAAAEREATARQFDERQKQAKENADKADAERKKKEQGGTAGVVAPDSPNMDDSGRGPRRPGKGGGDGDVVDNNKEDELLNSDPSNLDVRRKQTQVYGNKLMEQFYRDGIQPTRFKDYLNNTLEPGIKKKFKWDPKVTDHGQDFGNLNPKDQYNLLLQEHLEKNNQFYKTP